MSTTRAELTWAERAYRLIAQAIPPILASGHVSQSAGLWLAGVFLLVLILVVLSAYFGRTKRLH